MVAKAFWLLALPACLVIGATASKAIPISVPTPASDVTRSAFALVAQGKLDAAEKAFQAFKAKNPASPDPYLGLAYIAMQRHDLTVAKRYLDDGIAIAPNFSRLYLTRGRILALQAKAELAAGDLEKAVRLDDTSTEALLALGDLYLGPLGQPQKALGCYQRVIAIDANNAAGYFGEGVALAMAHQNQAARAAFKQSEKIAPNNPRPAIEVARLSAGERRFADALGLLDLVVKKFPDSFDAFMLKGAVHASLGQQDLAVGAFKSAVSLQQNSLPALTSLAAAARMADKLDESESAYKRALTIAPHSPMVLNSYAWMLAHLPNRAKQALAMATEAVKIAPNEAAFHDTRGYILMQLHDAKAATVEFEKALALDPASEARAHLSEMGAAKK